MVGTIALSEVLGFRAMDAGFYRRCGECESVVRGEMTTCCGRIACGIVTTVAEILDLKRRDPEYADLVDSIRYHGIGTPVLIYGKTLHNGSHRVAAADALGLPEVPWCNDSSIGWGDDWPDDSLLDCGA